MGRFHKEVRIHRRSTVYLAEDKSCLATGLCRDSAVTKLDDR